LRRNLQGKRWTVAGHDVLVGVRDAAAPRVTSAVAAAGARARAVSVGEAAKSAGVVVLATPYSSTEAAIAACGDLRGKIVVDCTNPVAPRSERSDHRPLRFGRRSRGTLGEGRQGYQGTTRQVRAIMLNPRYGDETLSMFFCGDDADAKKTGDWSDCRTRLRARRRRRPHAGAVPTTVGHALDQYGLSLWQWPGLRLPCRATRERKRRHSVRPKQDIVPKGLSASDFAARGTVHGVRSSGAIDAGCSVASKRVAAAKAEMASPAQTWDAVHR
jgi:hypothetical protein